MALCECESAANYHKSHMKLLMYPQKAANWPVGFSEIFSLTRRLSLHTGNSAAFVHSDTETRLGLVTQFSQVFLRTVHFAHPAQRSWAQTGAEQRELQIFLQ